MQNISALALNDLPYITGLTPADAFQNLLEKCCWSAENDPAERAMVLSYGGVAPAGRDPKHSAAKVKHHPQQRRPNRAPSKDESSRREHACRRLGRSGEEVVLASSDNN
jgi:hypothetical protein